MTKILDDMTPTVAIMPLAAHTTHFETETARL